MKLDLECVRAVLLVLEKGITLYEEDGVIFVNSVNLIGENNLTEMLPDFSKCDIAYTVEKLGEAGFIDIDGETVEGGLINLSVTSITYAGHEFLENIRDNETYRKVKKVGKDIGNFALSVVGEIAKNMALGAAQAFLPRME